MVSMNFMYSNNDIFLLWRPKKWSKTYYWNQQNVFSCHVKSLCFSGSHCHAERRMLAPQDQGRVYYLLQWWVSLTQTCAWTEISITPQRVKTNKIKVSDLVELLMFLFKRNSHIFKEVPLSKSICSWVFTDNPTLFFGMPHRDCFQASKFAVIHWNFPNIMEAAVLWQAQKHLNQI